MRNEHPMAVRWRVADLGLNSRGNEAGLANLFMRSS